MAKVKSKPKPVVDSKHSFSIVNADGDVVARRLKAREALEKIETLRAEGGKKKDYRLVNDSPPPCLHPKKSK